MSGSLLWELWTGGRNPYPTFTNSQVLDEVLMGYRLERPKLCPPEVHTLMGKCWLGVRGQLWLVYYGVLWCSVISLSLSPSTQPTHRMLKIDPHLLPYTQAYNKWLPETMTTVKRWIDLNALWSHSVCELGADHVEMCVRVCYYLSCAPGLPVYLSCDPCVVVMWSVCGCFSVFCQCKIKKILLALYIQ